jgi:hypothetical protein
VENFSAGNPISGLIGYPAKSLSGASLTAGFFCFFLNIQGHDETKTKN